jgi:hypothetical protein
MCSAIISIITFPSEREIRRHDMSCGGCADAYWNMASIIFCPLEYLLCFVSVVCVATRAFGIEAIAYNRGIDGRVRPHNLCEIIDGELD